ncbi:MAG: TonB family protein [Chitinophagales bacterium]|nr:TonB family protein [Bacteroidota bacterium]MBK7569389.1 TonB family protein [Bacteroidota bacterium]MBP8915294.1 TonB family protein [Chitinophagales bacterium]MBP9219881.1 TonB family protein [Chitinophagales bacterium]MBP9794452.1 TonB family protein [Chitinophagales bacterium]
MRPILFTSLVFFFFWGCSNSVENNKTQIQTESIPALAVEIPLQEIEDTIKDNNKNSIVPEHVRFEEYDPIPRERYEDVPAPLDEKFTGLEQIYHTFEKKPELFEFDCNTSAEIVAQEGTRILIPENAFVYAYSGLPASGQIDFRVTEYYKMEDILLSKLSCNTPEALLESGGMLYLEAYSGSLPCQVAPGKKLAIEFVGNTASDNMSVFDGKVDADGDIIWDLQYSNFPDPVIYIRNNTIYYGDPTNTLYTACDKMPEFDGGNIDMRIWVNSQLKYPQEAMDAKVEGQIYASFIVTDSGTIRNIQIEKRLGYGCDEKVIEMLNKMPNWKPGFENDIAVDVKIVMPIVFTLDDGDFLFGVNANDMPKQKSEFRDDLDDDDWFNGAFYNGKTTIVANTTMIEKLGLPTDTFSQISNATTISNALMYSIKIGWINCDRFIKIEEPKTNYTVALGNDEDVDLTLVFDNYNSVMRGKRSNGLMQFKNVLINEPITLFGIKNIDGQFYYCYKKSTTTDAKEKGLEFIPATKEELKAIAATLNKPVDI